MKSLVHFVVSLLFSIPAIIHGDFLLFAAIMFAGWLVDADHEVDYFYLTGKFIYNPLKLVRVLGGDMYSENLGKYVVPLHGWEWLALMILLRVNVVIVISYFTHLSLDVLGNSLYPRGMSVLCRWKDKWRVEVR